MIRNACLSLERGAFLHHLCEHINARSPLLNALNHALVATLGPEVLRRRFGCTWSKVCWKAGGRPLRSFFEPDLDDAADAGVVAGLDIAVSVWLSKAWEY